jgi:hypothetical protein
VASSTRRPSSRPILRRKTTTSAIVPARFTSEVASGIPHTPRRKNAMLRTTWKPRLPSAIQVGIHGDWRLKNARFSISIVPLKVRPMENAARASATTSV